MKTKKQKKINLIKKSNILVVQPPEINLNKDQKYVLLCNIVDYLASYGITKNREISEMANTLSNHDKLRGIKRSNTCYRKKHIIESKFSKMINDSPDKTVGEHKYSTENFVFNPCKENKENNINAGKSDTNQSSSLNNVKKDEIDKEVSRIINEVMNFMGRLKLPCKVS